MGAALLLSRAAQSQQVNAQDAPASSPAAADAVNAANSPLTPKITVNLHDYFLPSLNGLGDRQANLGLLRGLVPSGAFGVPQLIRYTLPLATSPTFPTGSATGLGDLTLIDFVVFPTKSILLGVGPLLVAPTATSRNTGAGQWQVGAAAVAVAPQSWGLLGGIVTYQHAFAGDYSRPIAQLVTVQPLVTYNLPDGFYLRSTGVMTFDLANHTTTVPVGFGVGRVWSFANGNAINAFVEPQYSVIRSGVGVPVWQVFVGINFQFAMGGR